jgi:acetyl-CoA carboxylase biotin carboxyl carrier protein
MDVRERITALAEVMDEYRLAEARLQAAGLTVAFRRRATRPATVASTSEVVEVEAEVAYFAPAAEPVAEASLGTPITSPMTGIFYRSPSPGAPSFVKEGESVTAGQIVGLIEAMKVFNEIPSTTSGTVVKVVAEAGQLVQPGDVLLYVS